MEHVYALICPIENKIKYIGLSKNIKERFLQHCSNPLKTTKLWILKLKKNNQKPKLIILETTDKNNGNILEKKWINFYNKIDKLLNKNLKKENETNVYTFRLDFDILTKSENLIGKKELRKIITKISNNYLKTLNK